MATRKVTKGIRRFNDRVRFWKPEVSILSEDNPFNEDSRPQQYFIAYESYPANRLDSLTEIDEKATENKVNSVSEVEWELQYTPGLKVKSSWRLEDLYDNRFYEITSPMTVNGRGISYRIVTNIIE